MTTAILGTPVSDLMTDVLQYQYNPAGIQSAVMQALTNATNGSIDVVDPTNPFVFCLESAAVLTAAAMSKNEANTRKQYPFSAQTPEDLYLHMSDMDYVNRFAIPSTAKFSLLLPLAEILNKMVVDPATNIRKLVIPRNTYFIINNINFSIQYPIEIRQLAHGGLQVVYDADITSPLYALTTNIIEFEIRNNQDGQYLYFEIDTQQFDIISNTSPLNTATDFSIDVGISDQYYYARVYSENADGSWTEIKTTHTDQIYDITVPTAVIKVTDKNVNVSIPQIYTGTAMLNKSIRIDIYQTKGPLNLILWEYPFPAFTAVWQAYDNNDFNDYVAPLKTFRTIIVFSNDVVTGGSNGVTFDQLRTQVIDNAIGSPKIPITNAQISTDLSLEGYSIIKSIDNITSRIFLATKGMPQPTDSSLITPANASIETISVSIASLNQLATVVDNGSSVTITPDTLYQSVDGIVAPISTDKLRALLSQPLDQLAFSVTQGDYLYTPFHYVLDMTSNEFNVRPYYLDNPEIVTKLFVNENDTTLIQVNTGTYIITRTATGYAITVVTLSGDAYKNLADSEVQAQLAYVPTGEKDRAYLTGQLVGRTADNERIYSFDLSTNFNVNSNDNLQLTKFLMYSTEPRIVNAPLTTDFDILFTTSSYVGTQYVASSIDQVLGKFILPNNVVGITRETLRVRFGYALSTLWARARSVISSVPYKTWATDVPRIYSEDIYQRDSNGSSITFDNDGNPVTVILHHKGDPVLDTENKPTYEHLTGDVVLDDFGNPLALDLRGMTRQIDIMLIEGAYWFANDINAVNYRKLITNSLVGWLTSDLIKLKSKLLEQTYIYFYPNTTLGAIDVMVDNGVVRKIDAGLSFIINLSVSKLVNDNEALKTELSNSTIITIAKQLTKDIVSLDSITEALRGVYAGDVISTQVLWAGDAAKYSVITVVDNSQRCSIRKKLVALPNNSLVVDEDVVINFIPYELPNK